MPKLKRINKSSQPTSYQLKSIPENLSQRLNISVRLAIEVWKHDHEEDISTTYTLSLVGEACTRFEYKSWPDLISQYHYLMERDI